MRRNWPCSICGFTRSSTWRSMNPTKPVVCNSCKSKANLSKSGATDTSKQVAAVVTETTGHPTNPISCDIKPSTLLIKENNRPDRKVDPGGLFLFGANISDHVKVDQQEPKGKGKAVAIGNGQSSVGIDQDHSHSGLSLKSPSTHFDQNDIHDEINEDAAKKLVREDIEKLSFWNACSVKKKKRNKLPQFTPSPTERLFNQQLCHIEKEQEIVNNSSFPNEKDNSLYDDLFIYQKCNFIPENEIGLGAMLLPNPSTELSETRLSSESKE